MWRKLLARYNGFVYKFCIWIVELVFTASSICLAQSNGMPATPPAAPAIPQMPQAPKVPAINGSSGLEMPKISAPTLLFWGENDTATPLSDARRMEKLIPDAGLVTVAGAGHYAFLENNVGVNCCFAHQSLPLGEGGFSNLSLLGRIGKDG